MRPKKIILCVFEDEVDLSLLRMVLTVHGYMVLSCANRREAIAVCAAADATRNLDLVLAESDQVLAALKRISHYVPMVIIGDLKKWEEFHSADAIFDKQGSMADLIERVKVWVTRKRGPRKGKSSHAA
jgi:CheY-like chemotaxis protein